MAPDCRDRGGEGAGSLDAFLWPPAVQPGETIALAAPASGVARPAWEAGVRVLEEWGFRVKCGPEVFSNRSLGGGWPDASKRSGSIRRSRPSWRCGAATAL
ncbi:MAG: hypothetical protein NTW80_13340 [Deltaproteobacteria bacterium]|nr:hypothetical protein [Deltaproteobacteria bacterium]